MDYFGIENVEFIEHAGGKFVAIIEVEPVSKDWLSMPTGSHGMIDIDSGAACIRDSRKRVVAYIGGGAVARDLGDHIEEADGFYTWHKLSNAMVKVEVIVFDS